MVSGAVSVRSAAGTIAARRAHVIRTSGRDAGTLRCQPGSARHARTHGHRHRIRAATSAGPSRCRSGGRAPTWWSTATAIAPRSMPSSRRSARRGGAGIRCNGRRRRRRRGEVARRSRRESASARGHRRVQRRHPAEAGVPRDHARGVGGGPADQSHPGLLSRPPRHTAHAGATLGTARVDLRLRRLLGTGDAPRPQHGGEGRDCTDWRWRWRASSAPTASRRTR